MSIENLINRAFTIEEKAIRRVRTIEGSRMYGQPIGTVITRDMIERAKRKRAREKAKNNSSDRTVNRSQSAEPTSSSASTAKKPSKSSKVMRSNKDGDMSLQQRLSNAKHDLGVANHRKNGNGSDATKRTYARKAEKLESYIDFLENGALEVPPGNLKPGHEISDGNDWKKIAKVQRNYRNTGYEITFEDGSEKLVKNGDKVILDKNSNEALTSKAKAQKDDVGNYELDEKTRVGKVKKGDLIHITGTGNERVVKVADIKNVGKQGTSAFDTYNVTFDDGTSRAYTDIDSLDVMRRKGDKPSTAKKPIPEDFSEPGLPGMGKFKSKAESNRKRHEKLLAKMSQGSEVVDEKGNRTFYKVSKSPYNLDNLHWESNDPDDDKKYSDAELAEELKGTADFSYTHMNEEGELVKEHWGKSENVMGGTTQPVERPSTRKKPSEPNDGGSTSEPEFRELRAGIIREGDLIRHKGEWKKVEFTETSNGKVMLSLEGVAEDLIVPIDRAFEVQYPGGKKPVKGAPKEKRKPGTSLFGGSKKPGDDDSSSATTGDKRDASKVESPDGYEEGAVGNASNLKPGDKVFDTVYRNGKSSKVVLTVESTDRRKNNGKSYTYSIKFTNGTGNSGTIGVTRYTRAIPKGSNTSSAENSGSGNDSGSSTESTPPKKVVPAPDKFADSNDVNIEPRPLTGDEISKRALKYEEEALAQIKKYRDSRGSKYSFGTNEGQRGYTPTEEEFNKLEAFPSNKTPESLDDLSWAKANHIADVEFARWGSLTLVRKSAGGSDEKLFLKFGSGYVTEYGNYIDRRNGRPTVKDKATLSHIKENYGDWLDRDLPKRVKRTETPFWDYWNGIRGVDWMADEETDDDYKSKEAFKRKNAEESQRLGVVVKGNFNPEQHAVLNSVLETYQERYPGLLSKNIGGFGIVGGTNSFVAGFHANVNMGRSLKGSIGKEPMGTGANRLSFNTSYFSDNGSTSTDKWIGLERGAMMTGHFVGGDRVDIAEKMGLKPDHVHAMYTTNHEIGHAIGSWIFGETGVDDVRGREQGRANPERAKAVAKRYSDKVSKVFQRFGIMDDNSELIDHIDTIFSSELNDNAMARLKRLNVINQTALSAHLSAYGATNLHEVMAETWASYSMDEQPTEFALELGEIMEDLLLELSEESGLVPSEEKGISLRNTLMNKLYALSNG